MTDPRQPAEAPGLLPATPSEGTRSRLMKAVCEAMGAPCLCDDERRPTSDRHFAKCENTARVSDAAYAALRDDMQRDG